VNAAAKWAGPVRVFLVDDHEMVRRGVAEMLEAETDLVVVGEAGRVQTALRRVDALKPDVIVLDVRLPDGSGIDLCREVRSAHPEIKCLMLSAYNDDEAMMSAILAGASGYVLKDVVGGDLVKSVRAAAAGATLLHKAATARIQASLHSEVGDPRLGSLGIRERQILALIGEGLTNRQIGERLGLAEKTVKNYVSGLLEKLGLERRTQAAIFDAEQRFEERNHVRLQH